MNTKTKKCVMLKDICVNAYIRVEFPIQRYERMVWESLGKWRGKTEEEIGDLLQNKCDDFVEFLRDHRSQDMIDLEVVRTRKSVCSACMSEWEPVEEDGVVFCAYCGAEVETLKGTDHDR